MTHRYLGDYYWTCPTTVEDEVRSALARSARLHQRAPAAAPRLAARLGVGFTVRDGDYLSARWPGDAHRFAADLAARSRYSSATSASGCAKGLLQRNGYAVT